MAGIHYNSPMSGVVKIQVEELATRRHNKMITLSWAWQDIILYSCEIVPFSPFFLIQKLT